MKKARILLLISSLIFFIGGATFLGLFALPYLQARQAAATMPAVSVATQQTEPMQRPDDYIGGTPRHITVPSVGIDLAVLDGHYNEQNGEWTLGYDGAYFATPTSPISNQHGNTLIYGHNHDAIFAKLAGVKAGDKATVATENGYVFTYVYKSSEDVKPTDVWILNDNGYPQMTLQTCTGFLDQYRKMYFWSFESYAKA
ncbi:MAG: peptidase sortase [Candidatus Saccharibacteria bacterium]|nr:peptidase sortase [Candidatus Saccharibacteria bacterium]